MRFCVPRDPEGSGLLINLVGPKILRIYTSFPAAVPSISREMCSNIAIWGHSWLVQCVQYFLQISKQTIGQIVCLEFANVEALMENVQVEHFICK